MSAQRRRLHAVVELSARDRELIRGYGYPFEKLERALGAHSSSEHIEEIAVDPFELEQLIGQLSISTNECDNDALQLELNDLCERLEDEERRLRDASKAARR